jgi:hydroxymethylbilane synthase
MPHFRIGSRGSRLAMWQADFVAQKLHSRGHTTSIEVIKTTGDRLAEVTLSQVGTKGMFTKEIEEALGAGQVDLAVHSLKDVPTEVSVEFELAVILEREDPRDAFVSVQYTELQSLPPGARIGTSSLRRQSQLLAFRSDLKIEALRGNVDTRVRRLEAGDFDAIILAKSGLMRLDRTEHVRATLDAAVMCPAPGQGALAIEIRRDDRLTQNAIAFLDHSDTKIAVECERAVLASLGGGCQVPIGAYAVLRDSHLEVSAVVARPDGSEVIRARMNGRADDMRSLGSAVAEQLIKRGADAILSKIQGLRTAAPEQP